MTILTNDNWGARARFGMFIVGNEAVPEAEWWAMLPAGVSVHAARVTARAPWANWNDRRDALDFADDLHRGSQQFATMRLQAVIIGHSSSSFLGGKGWDEKLVEQLSGYFEESLLLSTNGLDTIAALKHRGIKRPFLVLPPWFGPSVVEAGMQYYRDHGFEPAASLSIDAGPMWRDVSPQDLYSKGYGFEQDNLSLHEQVLNACPDAADGILIAGTGFRCVGILESLEQLLGKPVVSANQASLWHCLRQMQLNDAISGYGSLLRL